MSGNNGHGWSPIVRFLSHIEVMQNGCWLWDGAIQPEGYGKFNIGKTDKAHRFSFEYFKGEIPKGLEIDHLCRNRKCVNPSHLEAVTHKVNSQRGIGGEVARSRMLAKTHCKQGHLFDKGNTYYCSNGWRSCRACHREWGKIRRQKKNENLPVKSRVF